MRQLTYHGCSRVTLIEGLLASGSLHDSGAECLTTAPGGGSLRCARVSLPAKGSWRRIRSSRAWVHVVLRQVCPYAAGFCSTFARRQVALRMRSRAKALYALACLLGLLSLIVLELESWWRYSGCPQEQFLRWMLVCTWVSFAAVYPIAAALVIVHWPAKATGLRKTLLVTSLAILLAVWILLWPVALMLRLLWSHWD